MHSTLAAWVQFPGAESHRLSVSSHAVAAGHIEELEGLTTRIYNYVLGLWGEKNKREEDWQQMLTQGESFPITTTTKSLKNLLKGTESHSLLKQAVSKLLTHKLTLL